MKNNEAGASADPGASAKKSINIVSVDSDHGAIRAADGEMFLHRYAWEQAVRYAVGIGEPFTADGLQSEMDLPDIGNATGGVFMSLHRAGVIRRVGYRPSSKSSRAGGVVAIWVGGEAA